VPSIDSTVTLDTVHVEALDPDWQPIPGASGDYLTEDDAKAYIAREYRALKTAALLFTAVPFIMPVFTIDGEQYVPAEYTVGGGGDVYVIHVGDLQCAHRIRFDGVHIVGARQPLVAGSFYPNAQALADALRDLA